MAVAGVGMLAYLGAAVATDLDALKRALAGLGWSGAGLVLGLSLLNYVVRFQRWHLYLRELGHRLPWGRHFLVYIGGFTFTVSPAKAGEAVRGLYLRDHGVSYGETFAALFVERLLDFTAYALLATLIVSRLPAYRPLVAGAFAIAAVLLLLAGRPALPAFIERLGAGRSTRLGSLLSWIAGLLRSSRQLLSARLLLPGLLLGVLSWGAEGVGFWLICDSLDLPVTTVAAISIYAIAGLAGAVAFFMPGGIGGMEGAMVALLATTAGVDPAVAFVATLMCRLATLWFAVVVGFFCTAILEFQNWRPAPRTS